MDELIAELRRLAPIELELVREINALMTQFDGKERPIPDASDAQLAMLKAADTIASLQAELARAREALEPFAKAAMGVETFDPDFPMDGAALRASFDWYDKCQDEPLKRHSVRRSDLERARAALAQE